MPGKVRVLAFMFGLSKLLGVFTLIAFGLALFGKMRWSLVATFAFWCAVLFAVTFVATRFLARRALKEASLLMRQLGMGPFPDANDFEHRIKSQTAASQRDHAQSYESNLAEVTKHAMEDTKLEPNIKFVPDDVYIPCLGTALLQLPLLLGGDPESVMDAFLDAASGDLQLAREIYLTHYEPFCIACLDLAKIAPSNPDLILLHTSAKAFVQGGAGVLFSQLEIYPVHPKRNQRTAIFDKESLALLDSFERQQQAAPHLKNMLARLRDQHPDLFHQLGLSNEVITIIDKLDLMDQLGAQS